MTIPYKEVEERLLRACRTLRALPDKDRPRVLKTYWPITADDEVAYGYNDAAMPKFRPSPADVSDMLPALDWTQGMPKKEFRFIWWRSCGCSFGRMADFIHKSHDTARNCYIEAMRNAWYRAQLLAEISTVT